MIKWLVFMLFLATVVADVYIYRGVICRWFRKLPARVSYVVFALLTDGTALAAFGLIAFSGSGSSAGLAVAMWLVWGFLLTSLPKVLFASGALLDYLTGLAVRRRVRVFRATATVFSVAMVVVMTCGATVGRNKFRVVEVEVCSDKIPEAFDGYRIVQISDIHIGTMVNPEKHISRLAERIATLRPDMVVNTGDLVNMTHAELTPEVTAALSRITASDGTFSIWGNHDLGFYIRDTTEMSVEENFARLGEKMRQTGWRVLSNESVWIRRVDHSYDHLADGSLDRMVDSLLLSGIDYPNSGHRLNAHNHTLGGADIPATFRDLPGDLDSIVLAHTPNLWGEITAAGRGDLTLAGHVHAMQMKLRLGSCIFSPARWMYDEWSGLYGAEGGNGEKKILYVNDGIGCVGYPMRIGARPEITVFTLKRHERQCE
jgi:predicted MPP superfamily phosphohydrolase